MKFISYSTVVGINYKCMSVKINQLHIKKKTLYRKLKYNRWSQIIMVVKIEAIHFILNKIRVTISQRFKMKNIFFKLYRSVYFGD